MIIAERSPAAANISITTMLELIEAYVLIISYLYHLLASFEIAGLSYGHLAILLCAFQWILFITRSYSFHCATKADLLDVSPS